jgi:predicted nucleic acid-binding protein
MEEILKSRVVFIDTCVFRNLGFRFDHDVLSEFRRLCQEEEFELVTTEITQQEIAWRTLLPAIPSRKLRHNENFTA